MPTKVRVVIVALLYLFAAACGGGGGSASKSAANPEITATAGANGSISPSGTLSVNYGTDLAFAITPDSNYHVLDVVIDGISMGPITAYTLTNVKTNHLIQASFELDPQITATAGANGSISPSGTLSVNYGTDLAFAITPDSNYYVLDVAIDGISIGPTTIYTFTNVTGNHVIKASFDIEHQLIAMGDSITEGFGDDLVADDNSQDGKNNGGGFEPILNDLLTAYEIGFPHDIVNEGVAGDTSADGVAFIPTALDLYPHAKKYLLLYGTNEADIWKAVPSGRGLNPGDAGYPGTYKDNMQQIIDAINNAGKKVCLAKIPIALGDGPFSIPYPDPDNAARNVLIKEYNQVIDELVNDPSNGITVPPPDFYNYFKDIDPVTGNPRYVDQYSDNLHPNGFGYQSMANLWFDVLTQ